MTRLKGGLLFVFLLVVLNGQSVLAQQEVTVEDGTSVSVFAWNHQGLHNGMRVRVTGTFAKIKQVGRYTFYNEVQAQRVEELHPEIMCGQGLVFAQK